MNTLIGIDSTVKNNHQISQTTKIVLGLSLLSLHY